LRKVKAQKVYADSLSGLQKKKMGVHGKRLMFFLESNLPVNTSILSDKEERVRGQARPQDLKRLSDGVSSIP
jgi:hypothetical protein